ncbi:beta strand repeat-containing protein [Novosphingobium panipatense]|uniref:beta strand repeat-containing protein n=1 Tax=Novosphingobium panipatense TaxID=428991 RepID=UPI00361B4223
MAGDGVTNVGTVSVSGLEPSATWQYRINGGAWTTGTGTSFVLADGTYGADAVQVRQIDVAGNASGAFSLPPVTVDTSTGPLTAELVSDTGLPDDGVTSDGTVAIGNLEPGASWQYSTDGGATWQAGTGTSFELAQGTYADVQVRQVNAVGVISDPTYLGPVTVDATGPAVPVATFVDSGTQGDGITNNGTVSVGGLEPGVTWQYSTDGGATWQTGTGTSFELGSGTYPAGTVQVRQVDLAGNAGGSFTLPALTVDTAAPAALTATIADTGVPGDAITSDSTVTVSGLEPGATWQYSTDSGATWQTGTGASFELAPGSYGAGEVRVRQVDAAGTPGAVFPLPAVTVDTTIAAPTAALATDTGASAGDGLTADATVLVGGLEPGATWQYSTNGGASWQAGTGTSFELAPGTYGAGVVQVRQTDIAGNQSAGALLGAVTVDTAVASPTVVLAADTGLSASDRVTNDATVTVGGIEPGASWQYSTDGGATWQTGTGTSFELAPGTYGTGVVQVRQTDLAGNVSAPAALAPVTIDLTAAPPSLALATDTGTSPDDGVTSDATVAVGGLEPGATWQYSTNGGATWQAGTGTSFELAPGTYPAGAVQVRQTDIAGNISRTGTLPAVTIDLPLAVDDNAALDLGAVTSVTYPTVADTDVEVLGLLESDVGVDNALAITVADDRTASVRIEISQTALVAVADAFRVDLIDAAGNVVYSAVTPNSPLGDVAGLEVLGLTGDNTLVAIVEGLPPGDYRVVVRNDEGALEQLLDPDGNGVSLEELGAAGVVLGPENEELVLDAVAGALGPLGGVARGLLEPVLDSTTGAGVGGLVGVLTTLLNNPLINLPGLLDTVLGAVADTLLSNTLTLLQGTSVAATVTEYEFANEAVSGNVLTGNAQGGADDLAGGAVIVSISDGDGTTIAVPTSGVATIVGDFGVLQIAADGTYTYSTIGNPGAVGETDRFTYTLSDGVSSSSATLAVALDGAPVQVGNDLGTATVQWANVQDPNFFNASGTTVSLLGTGGYTSGSFVIGSNTAVSGTVSLDVTASALGNGTLFVERQSGTGWTPVAQQSFSTLLTVLGNDATIDLGTLGLGAGTYRVRASLNSALAVATVTSDVDVTYLNRFVAVGSTPATGNILANDEPGSLLTEVQVYNPDRSGFADVEDGPPLQIDGIYGTLSLSANGSYTYTLDPDLTYSNVARIETFTYRLVHPTEEVAQGTLQITVQPSGAGAQRRPRRQWRRSALARRPCHSTIFRRSALPENLRVPLPPGTSNTRSSKGRVPSKRCSRAISPVPSRMSLLPLIPPQRPQRRPTSGRRPWMIRLAICKCPHPLIWMSNGAIIA